MPRKRTKPADPEQSKRFIETAEEVGADTDDEALERALETIPLKHLALPAEKYTRALRSKQLDQQT